MRKSCTPRRGMTLVELLVVITILTILVAVAIPVMRPSLKDRKVREASRMLNTYIGLAKAKAAETGRPHGIWIRRDANNVNSSYQVFLAETPMPFAGDSYGATATLVESSTAAGYADSARISDIQNLVKEGDYIRFDFKGPKYRITSANSGTPPKKITFQAPSGQSLPALGTAASGPQFQVFRQPRAMTTQPLQLPTGTVIDLAYSGIGYDGQEMANTAAVPPIPPDIAITFFPGGGVFQLVEVPFDYNRPSPFGIPGTIHLLVGRTEQTPALETDATKHNINDGTASWISIGHLTGTVTTAENYYDASAGAQTVKAARTIAQTKQTMGGR